MSHCGPYDRAHERVRRNVKKSVQSIEIEVRGVLQRSGIEYIAAAHLKVSKANESFHGVIAAACTIGIDDHGSVE